ncbi:hypothetical protein MXB_1449 [Myxobolus squamalis]|nr:hypothetical protein MXB_1449 [Myxobolus squamalis]
MDFILRSIKTCGIHYLILTGKYFLHLFSQNFFYVKCARYFAAHEIPCRKVRTEQFECINDVDFKIKLHALRKAFEIVFMRLSSLLGFLSTFENILKNLIKIYGQPTSSFKAEFKNFFNFYQNPNNHDAIIQELKNQGVVLFTIYDTFFDLFILQSLDELLKHSITVKSSSTPEVLSYHLEKQVETLMYHFHSLAQQIKDILNLGLVCSDGIRSECCLLLITAFHLNAQITKPLIL